MSANPDATGGQTECVARTCAWLWPDTKVSSIPSCD